MRQWYVGGKRGHVFGSWLVQYGLPQTSHLCHWGSHDHGNTAEHFDILQVEFFNSQRGQWTSVVPLLMPNSEAGLSIWALRVYCVCWGATCGRVWRSPEPHSIDVQPGKRLVVQKARPPQTHHWRFGMCVHCKALINACLCKWRHWDKGKMDCHVERHKRRIWSTAMIFIYLFVYFGDLENRCCLM